MEVRVRFTAVALQDIPFFFLGAISPLQCELGSVWWKDFKLFIFWALFGLLLYMLQNRSGSSLAYKKNSVWGYFSCWLTTFANFTRQLFLREDIIVSDIANRHLDSPRKDEMDQ